LTELLAMTESDLFQDSVGEKFGITQRLYQTLEQQGRLKRFKSLYFDVMQLPGRGPDWSRARIAQEALNQLGPWKTCYGGIQLGHDKPLQNPIWLREEKRLEEKQAKRMEFENHLSSQDKEKAKAEKTQKAIDAAWKRLAKKAKDKNATERDAVKWVATNIHADPRDIDADKAPSGDAVSMLKWARADPKNEDTFFSSIWPKTMPPKTAIAKEGEQADDQTENKELSRAMAAVMEAGRKHDDA
jgi:hypothetical protein